MAAAEAVARPRPRRTASLLALAGGGCLALVAVAAATAYPDSSPLSPDHAGGEPRWSWLYLGASALAFVLYLAGLAVLSRRAARARAVVAVAFAIQLAPLAAPVLLSTDVYTYWARARVSVAHGGNPYVESPSRYPYDPAYDRMGASWRGQPTGYGPAFTLLSEGHAEIAGTSPTRAALLYKGLAAASMLVIVALAAALSREKAFAAAFVGWNPLLALQFAGGGHNDALMIALVLAALALASRGRRSLAGAAWATAIAVKWVPLLLLPLRTLEARRTGRQVGHAGFAAAAFVIAGLAFWRYGGEWLGSFGTFSGQFRRTTSLSSARWLTGAGLSETAALAILAAILAAGYVWLLREAWRGRARLGLCAGLVVVTASWLVPWYAVWAVPLAAIEDDRTARVVALALSAYLLRGAVPL